MTIKEICENIWEVEKKYDLFNQKIQGVYFWKLVRFPTVKRITEKTGLYGQAHTSVKKSYTEKLSVLPKMLWNTYFNGVKYRKNKVDTLIFQHARKVKIGDEYIDIYTNELIKELEEEVENKGIYLKFKKQRGSFKITADEQKLKIALTNIIGNAIKYTEQGGVLIDLKRKENSILLSVSDTGVGIEPQDIETIFSKVFERGDSARKIFATGRGIGLYIASRIIEDHNGSIKVESAGKDQGSSFFINLPI